MAGISLESVGSQIGLAAAGASAGVRRNGAVARLAMLVWFIPLFYPAASLAMTWTAGVAARHEVWGLPALAASIIWAMSGPVIGVLVLNHLDRTAGHRMQHRLAVSGALLAAVTPPLFVGLAGWLSLVNADALWIGAWYGVAAFVAVVSLTVTPSLPAPAVGLRRVHGYAALLVTAFALVHMANQTAAFISLDAHAAVLGMLRPIYRERVLEGALIGSIVLQAVSGGVMVWRTHLRKATAFRNVQTVSGLYLAVFFGSHLLAVLRGRQGVDTTFAWATGGPDGLVAAGRLYMLPYYSLSVLALFVHLGCQARWNVARVWPHAPARLIAHVVIATGALAAICVALAACGVRILG